MKGKLLIVIEGGSTSSDMHARFRRNWAQFLEPIIDGGRKCGIPVEIARGLGRPNAIDRFLEEELAVLLIDSEKLPEQASTASHIWIQDKQGIAIPKAVTDDHVYLMVACTETWLLAHPDSLRLGIRDLRSDQLKWQPNMVKKLPTSNFESMSKDKVFEHLAKVLGRQSYGRCKNATTLSIGHLDRDKVCDRCPSAKRLFEELPKFIERHASR